MAYLITQFNSFEKFCIDEIERIHNYIVTQYEPGGKKYLESQHKIHLLTIAESSKIETLIQN